MERPYSQSISAQGKFFGLAFAVLLATLAHGERLMAQRDCDCSCESYQKLEEASEQFRTAAKSGDFASIAPEVMQMTRCSGVCAQQWQNCKDEASEASAESAALPKSQLTPDYLQGTWCSVYGGQETTEWLFHGDGSYQIGVPAGTDYALHPNIRSLDQFRSRFETLIEFKSDSFTTLHEHGRKNVFERGACG